MKKSLFLAVAMLVSGGAFASTEHYVLRDGNHVHHLKVTKIGEDVSVTTDIDFEPNSGEQGSKACSASISDDAKQVGANELVVKKQIPSEAHYCTLSIHLSADGAKIDQSEECGYFAAGICHFDSDGKELVRVK
ncbi:hypothetical protein [Methylomagnum ishizawai]|uniref:hypothetical protein n=1 Tax=Methylomagnum ishizawai TaxID=1760988 RepID=UPI001C32E647|nr:hypothetical protein [Methylomagnum ishizawai]BBL76746.1 hypothetical protein MishRS11D_38440 [Methylomagnum ishizawai]